MESSGLIKTLLSILGTGSMYPAGPPWSSVCVYVCVCVPTRWCAFKDQKFTHRKYKSRTPFIIYNTNMIFLISDTV